MPPKGLPRLTVHFFREFTGTEPVRDWLKGLADDDKREIGTDIKTVQFGWPIGKKERKTPKADLDLAKQRLKKLRSTA